MTSLHVVCPQPHYIIHIKFGEHRMRNDEVITLRNLKQARKNQEGLTFWAVTSVLVGILRWGQALQKAEMTLFRTGCGQN